ncbi:MAG: hypothetical protein AB7E80_14670 [Hyphomicrobiaceae bacterium]
MPETWFRISTARAATAAAFGLALAAGPSLALPAAVAADTPWLGEPEIRAAFAGVTLEGRYGNGQPFSERYLDDGRIEYSERGHTARGRWSLQAGTFCTIYDSDPTGGCYRVKKAGLNCFEFYFVARTEEQAEKAPRDPSWTARGSVVGKPGTCTDEQTV